MLPKSKRAAKLDRSDSEMESEPHRSSRNKGKSGKDYKLMHEGAKKLSPVHESASSASVSESTAEEEVDHDNTCSGDDRSDDGSQGDSEATKVSDEQDNGSLDGHTPHTTDEDELDIQIHRHQQSLEKIKQIELESKKRISSLQKLLCDKAELDKAEKRATTPERR